MAVLAQVNEAVKATAQWIWEHEQGGLVDKIQAYAVLFFGGLLVTATIIGIPFSLAVGCAYLQMREDGAVFDALVNLRIKFKEREAVVEELCNTIPMVELRLKIHELIVTAAGLKGCETLVSKLSDLYDTPRWFERESDSEEFVQILADLNRDINAADDLDLRLRYAELKALVQEVEARPEYDHMQLKIRTDRIAQRQKALWKMSQQNLSVLRNMLQRA